MSDVAQRLIEIAQEAALELQSSTIGGALTFEEFVAVLGDNWLGWIPENDGNPRDWKTDEELYEEFTLALASYRANGDPNYRAYKIRNTNDEENY